MDTVIKLAKGKYKDGWKSLFEQNKQKVYFLCQWLIKDDYRKDEVFIEVFKEAFSKLDQTSLNTEEDFSKFICLETIKMCKQEEFSGNPHVFKNYKCEHNDFVDDTNKSSSRNFENSKEEIKNCVSKLNEPLQFILYTSKMSSLSTRDLSKVLGVEEMKMDALVQEALQELKVESIPVCEYSSLFTQGMNTTKVPSSTEEKMMNFMNENGKKQPKSNNKFMVIALVLLAVIGGIVGFISGSNAKSGDTYIASVEVENYGTIEMELYEDVAPITVKNFVDLAESGFYDGLTFHRIMDGFMIQGGDPSHNGTGGSSTQIKGEFESNGIKNELSHVRGTVSMARSQMPDSASSQFFIVQQDSTFLDGNYAAFGTVTSGMDIVDRIAKDANPTDDNGTIPFEEQPVIKSITIKKKDA